MMRAERQADGDAAHGGRPFEGAPDRGEEDGERIASTPAPIAAPTTAGEQGET